MIESIRTHNFKSFDDLNIDLKPITLFLGPNNSGKSSILSILRILVQTLESNDISIPLLLDGILGDFGTYKDIVFGNNTKRNICVELSFKTFDIKNIKANYQENPEWNEIHDKKFGFRVNFGYRSKRREIVLKGLEILKNGQSLIKTKYSEESERQLLESIGEINIPIAIKSSISDYLRFHNFLPRGLLLYPEKDNSPVKKFYDVTIRDLIRDMSICSSDILRELLSVEYIGAMRVPPKRTFLYTGERRRRVGSNGESAGSIIALDDARGGSKSKNILHNVSLWMEKAQIASAIKINTISDRHYELKLKHPITNEEQNLADVGFGSSQIMPVLVGGYNLPQGSTYIVEEPEIHLHPRAQSELGEFLLDLYNRNVQSVIETHSEYLILRLQQYVAEGKIPPDHIKIYYVYAKNGKKTATPLDLDKSGRFIQKWPEGFFPEQIGRASCRERV